MGRIVSELLTEALAQRKGPGEVPRLTWVSRPMRALVESVRQGGTLRSPPDCLPGDTRPIRLNWSELSGMSHSGGGRMLFSASVSPLDTEGRSTSAGGGDLWRRETSSGKSWQAARAERDRRVREKKHHHRVQRTLERNPERAKALEPDVHQIVADFKAPDEAARGKAVRQVCPCRMGWEVFQDTMEPLRKMTKDPSAYVRAQALHVFQDAFQMQSMESRKEQDLARSTRQRCRQAGPPRGAAAQTGNDHRLRPTAPLITPSFLFAAIAPPPGSSVPPSAAAPPRRKAFRATGRAALVARG